MANVSTLLLASVSWLNVVIRFAWFLSTNKPPSMIKEQHGSFSMFISSVIDKSVSQKILAKQKRIIAEVYRSCQIQANWRENPYGWHNCFMWRNWIKWVWYDIPLAQVWTNPHQVQATTAEAIKQTIVDNNFLDERYTSRWISSSLWPVIVQTSTLGELEEP